MASTVKTRVLIISDTHNAPLSSREDANPTAPFKSPLPSADLLIHCGDLTMTGQLHEYHRTLDMLAEIDAPV
jgi:predicted phosphodiesterase